MGWDNWDMIEVEKYESVDSNDAKKRERYWIEFYKASLNKNIPLRTQSEHYEDNKDNFLKYHKEYREENKEIISEKKKEYREKNKEYFKEYHKEYREKNKEYFKEYHKEYRENNKEIIAEKKGEKLICECGCIIRKDGLFNHQKTKNHLSFIS
jgi:hypothetical protein